MGDIDEDAEAARLRDGFTALAEESPDANAILNSGIVENAVETVLHLLRADNPQMAQISEAFRNGELREGSARMADRAGLISDAMDETSNPQRLENLRYALAQLVWCKGAIAACWSLKEGRQWYEAAIDMDPDNFWLKLETIKFLIWANAAEDARRLTLELLGMSSDPDAIVTAFSVIGEVHEKRGEYKEALDHYRRALLALEQLAETAPGDLDAGLDLCRARFDIARALDAAGKAEEAAASRDAGRSAIRELVPIFSGHAMLAALLGGQLASYALSLRGEERWSDADLIYREALFVVDGMPATDQSIQFVTGLCHEGLGDIHDEQDAPAEAASAWSRARDLYRSCRDTVNDDFTEANDGTMRAKAAGRLAEVEEKLAGIATA